MSRSRTAAGLLPDAIPKVDRQGRELRRRRLRRRPEREVDLIARIERNFEHAPLAGFVVEGLSPYGIMTSTRGIG